MHPNPLRAAAPIIISMTLFLSFTMQPARASGRPPPPDVPAAEWRAIFLDPDASAEMISSVWGRQQRALDEIRAHYPEIQLPEDQSFRPSVGWALFQAGRVSEGVEVMIREADLLLPHAQTLLTLIYHPGFDNGPPRHAPEIRAFFERTAEEGFYRSKWFLGKIHGYGWGVPRDLSRGLRLLEAAGLQSADPDVYDDLARLLIANDDLPAARRAQETAAEAWYERGLDAEENDELETAVEAYAQALAFQPGHVPSLINLGLVHQVGPGALHDEARAFELFVRASAEDPAMGGFLAASGLLYGRGAERDPDRGMRLLRRSVEAGFPPAVETLKVFERTGEWPRPYWERRTRRQAR